MPYHQYLTVVNASSDELLNDWRWLVGPSLQIWHVTKFGDAFLRDTQNGSIHFLDTAAGKLELAASEEAEFEAIMKGPKGNEWLMPDVVDGQALLGMCPGTNECLSFIHPPALGGKLDPDNIEISAVSIHLSISGQIHRQIKDLPPGATIKNLKIVAPSPSKRPWWKFW